MGVKYNPKDASEAWPVGEYDATLIEVTETVSKSSGNDMEVWKFKLYGPDSREMTIREYVTSAAVFKIKALAKAFGKLAEFQREQFNAADYINQNLTIELKVETHDEYGDQNRIKTYKPSRVTTRPVVARPPEPSLGDQLKIAKLEAMNAFVAGRPPELKEDCRVAWGEAVAAYFNGRDESAIGINEWRRFAGDGFKRLPVPTSGAAFKDDEIPFGHDSYTKAGV
jgi:hypothetical protein